MSKPNWEARENVTNALRCMYTNSANAKGEMGGANKAQLISAHRGLQKKLKSPEGRAAELVKEVFGDNWDPPDLKKRKALTQHSKDWRLNEEDGVITCSGDDEHLDLLNKTLVALWDEHAGGSKPRGFRPQKEKIARETFDLLLEVDPLPMIRKAPRKDGSQSSPEMEVDIDIKLDSSVDPQDA